MKLGPFEIAHPFILAPMAGITNSPFRRLMRRQSSALMISELISANGLCYGSRLTKEMFAFENDERILGFQLFGENEEHLVKATQYVESIGADFVDLNLGCPVPKIVKNGAGSAMCRNPVSLGKILAAMVESVNIPVTIKIRTGWDEGSRNAQDVILAATDAGVRWVAVHGRTRAQGYSGMADWEFIGNLKAKSSIPIIGNGDVQTAKDAYEKWKTYGVDAILIGRAALRNPFIFQQAERLFLGNEEFEIHAEHYLELLDQHRFFLESTSRSQAGMVHAKKFLSWYSAGFPGSKDFRRDIFQIQAFEDVWNFARNFFARGLENRSMDFLNEAFLMGGHG